MMKSSIFAAAFAVLALTNSAFAQTVSYEFNNHTLDPTVHENFVTATPLSTPLAYMFGSGKFCAGAPWATTTPQGPFNQSQSYLEWTLTPEQGCGLGFDALIIESWRGGGHADTVEFGALYFDEVPGQGGDNFMTLIGQGDLYPQHSGTGSFTFDLSGVAAIQGTAQPVTFRLYLYGDQNSGTSAAEFERFEVQARCTGRVTCERTYATEVLGAMQGTTPISGHGDPTDALGQTSGYYSLGVGGELAVGFGKVFTNTGDSDADVYVWEWNGNDCYGIGLRAADAATHATLTGAGLLEDANGFFAIPHLFCGNAHIDIDQFIPGAAARSLRLDAVRILDDGSAGDGMEVVKVKVELGCNEACIGDRVFVDVNCDGIQDPRELGLAGVPITLFDSTGTVNLQSTTTDNVGGYKFVVGPGAYIVEVGVDPVRFTVSAKSQGNDDELDSDIDPSTNRTEIITVAANEQRTDVDAGLCLICVGNAPSMVALPACGLPVDPIMTATQPIVGSLWTLEIDSNLPGAVVLLFAQAGGPTTLQTYGGSSTNLCNIHLDLANLTLVRSGVTDQNGHWEWTIPVDAKPEHLGLQFTIQARLCLPGSPGPIPGFPDFLSTGLHTTIGCL